MSCKGLQSILNFSRAAAQEYFARKSLKYFQVGKTEIWRQKCASGVLAGLQRCP